MIKGAPVLTLWAAVVTEMLGFDYDEALTLERAVARLDAYSKGVPLGLFQPRPKETGTDKDRTSFIKASHPYSFSSARFSPISTERTPTLWKSDTKIDIVSGNTNS